jgi:NAD(P)-dependent dehydrogenase (short-subunit alcohol dehydrogenase family)
MFDLTGKTVVVTGGGRGIGRWMGHAVAEAGASVVVAGRNAEHIASAAQEIRDMGRRAIHVPTDITVAADLAHLVQAALDEFGYIDCWINNAGSADNDDVGPLLDVDEGQWDRVVDLNLKWSFFACQAAARVMTRGGSIIVISSKAGSIASPMIGHYAAAKAGIESLTTTMAVEWGHRNIRVNAIAPGTVLTPGSNNGVMAAPSRRLRQMQTIPLRRLGVPQDVAPLCVYLAADESSWVTGNVVQVTGGSRVGVGYLSFLHHTNKDLGTEDAATQGL